MARDPLDRVRAAAAARRELDRRRRAVEVRMARAVEDALLAGYGWADVGRALGISRQGARQRWGHLVAAWDLKRTTNAPQERR